MARVYVAQYGGWWSFSKEEALQWLDDVLNKEAECEDWQIEGKELKGQPSCVRTYKDGNGRYYWAVDGSVILRMPADRELSDIKTARLEVEEMTIKEIKASILTRYPQANCRYSIVHSMHELYLGDCMSIASGASPAQAWRNAYKIIEYLGSVSKEKRGLLNLAIPQDIGVKRHQDYLASLLPKKESR